MDDQVKHPLKSLGIMAPLAALLVFLANRFWPGLGVTDADVAPIIDTVDVLFGLVLGIAGRARATTQISTSGAIAALLLAAALSACSSTGTLDTSKLQADAPKLFAQGCAGVSYAHGAFLAAAPALVVAGKLAKDDLDKEAVIFASVEATCANPPADLATAGLALLGQASAIYLLIAVPS